MQYLHCLEGGAAARGADRDLDRHQLLHHRLLLQLHHLGRAVYSTGQQERQCIITWGCSC